MKEYKYLVVTRWEDDPEDEEDARVMTAAEIFSMMDNADCFPCELLMDIWRINGYGEALSECQFLGPWHDGEDPLKMAIVCEGWREIGYATDH